MNDRKVDISGRKIQFCPLCGNRILFREASEDHRSMGVNIQADCFVCDVHSADRSESKAAERLVLFSLSQFGEFQSNAPDQTPPKSTQ